MLIFCDGMDSYANSAEVTDKWSSQGAAGTTWYATAGRFGGAALTNGASQNNTLIKNVTPFGAVGQTIGAAGWHRMSAGPTTFTQLQLCRFGGTGILVGNSSTLLSVLSLAGVSLGTFTARYTDGSWHWYEVEMLLETAATGSVTVWEDGIQVFTVSGVITATTATLPIPSVGWTPASGVSGTATLGCAADDVMFWDSTGSAFNTFPIGPQRISTLNPTGAGALTQFTPSTGTNWSCVAGAYSGTAFVSDTGTGNADLYTYPALPINPVSIKAVVGNYWGQNPGLGTANLIPQLKTGSTTVSGSTDVLAIGSNRLFQQVWTADATGAAWAYATVNAMQVGMKD